MRIDEPPKKGGRVDQASSPLGISNTSNFQKSHDLKTDNTYIKNLNYGPDTQ